MKLRSILKQAVTVIKEEMKTTARPIWMTRKYPPGRDSQNYKVDESSRDYLIGFQEGAVALTREIMRTCFKRREDVETILPRDLIRLIKREQTKWTQEKADSKR